MELSFSVKKKMLNFYIFHWKTFPQLSIDNQAPFEKLVEIIFHFISPLLHFSNFSCNQTKPFKRYIRWLVIDWFYVNSTFPGKISTTFLGKLELFLHTDTAALRSIWWTYGMVGYKPLVFATCLLAPSSPHLCTRIWTWIHTLYLWRNEYRLYAHVYALELTHYIYAIFNICFHFFFQVNPPAFGVPPSRTTKVLPKLGDDTSAPKSEKHHPKECKSIFGTDVSTPDSGGPWSFFKGVHQIHVAS